MTRRRTPPPDNQPALFPAPGGSEDVSGEAVDPALQSNQRLIVPLGDPDVPERRSEAWTDLGGGDPGQINETWRRRRELGFSPDDQHRAALRGETQRVNQQLYHLTGPVVHSTEQQIINRNGIAAVRAAIQHTDNR